VIDLHNELAMAAAELMHSAPAPWKVFLERFCRFTEKAKEDCIRSPVDMIQVTQGRAQQCALLFELFADADKTAVRITDRRK
jgi:hypothetical protein